MDHNLKTWPEYFSEMRAGRKTFEVRKNDRDFKVGDILCLHEFAPNDGGFTGSMLKRRVTYVLHGGQFGVEAGYVVMGLG